jgi:hypothetical protein
LLRLVAALPPKTGRADQIRIDGGKRLQHQRTLILNLL